MKKGAMVPLKQFKALIELLQRINELFTWIPSDMLGIAISVITYEMKINPLVKPTTQSKMPMGDETQLAIRVEVSKLFNPNFVKENRF